MLSQGNAGVLLGPAKQDSAGLGVARILQCCAGLHSGIAKLSCIAQFPTINARLIDIDHGAESAVDGNQVAYAVIEMHSIHPLSVRRVMQAKLIVPRMFRAKIWI